MENIKNYDYRLFFGKNIKNPMTEVTEIPPLHAKQNFYIEIDKVKYSIVLSGLKFTRKVYEPGIIEAEVSIKSAETTGENVGKIPTFNQVEALLMDRQIELTIVDIDKFKAKPTGQNGEEQAQKTIDDKSETSIAKNYYVYMINPQIATNSGAKEMFVKLTIHSFDKLMDIDKYCKAYTAKKLAKDIITKELDTFGLPASLVSTEIANLQNLKYEDSTSTPTEKIQPYLVQYNETFLDFLVRTANRCGEFLFFEDGKLTLGLPTKTTAELSGFDSVTMQGYTDGIVDVEDYSRDSVKDNGTIAGELNFDAIEKDKSGLPNDAFEGKLNYNTPLAGEEYIFPLEDDKYTNLNRELCFRGKNFEQLKTIALKATAAIAACDDGNPIKLVATELAQTTTDSINAGVIIGQVDSQTKEDLKKDFGSNKEQYNNGRLVAFSSLDEKGWIGHKFYSTIRKLEEQQHQKIICIDMGTTYAPVSLGDKIQVDGLEGHYIVVQIRQIANLVWNRNYRKFNPSDPSTDLYSDRQSQVIYAIPVIHPLKEDKKTLDLTKETFVPPVAPVPMFRKASPQTAFVVDNSDNKYQGRVRIAYPWQSPNDAKRKAVITAETALKKAQDELATQKIKIKYLKEQLTMFENYIKPKLNEMKGMSANEREKYKTNLEKTIKDDEAELAKLERKLNVSEESITNEDFKEISLEKYQENEAKKAGLRLQIEAQKKKLEIERLSLKYITDAKLDPEKALQQMETDKTSLDQDKEKLDKAVAAATDAVASAKEDVANKVSEWDKEVKKSASPWVRVATPMATEGGGVYFTPNKGDEVLVNYDCDNVERPYVVGSVYSKNTLAPGESVDKFTKSFLQKRASMMLMSPNGQHISFNAPKDGWKFVQGFSPALKTLQTYFPALKGKDLDWGDGKDLAGGIYMGDRFGLYELSLSSHDRKVKIKSPYGNVEIGAFTGITINAPNGDIKICGKNVSIEAGNKLTLHSGTNIKDDTKIADMALDALKSLGKTLSDNTIGNLLNLKIVDMTVIRAVYEVFMRPIDGTLNLKSNNFVMLEAGKGKAQVPLDRYSPDYQEKLKMQDLKKQKIYGKMAGYIKLIDSKMNQFEKDYKNLKNEAYKKKAALDTFHTDNWKPDEEKPDVLKTAFGVKKLKDFKPNGENFAGGTFQDLMGNVTENKMQFPEGWLDFGEVKKRYQSLVEGYAKAIINLHAHANRFETLFDDQSIKDINKSVLNLTKKEVDNDTQWIDNVFKVTIYDGENSQLAKHFKLWKDRYVDGQKPKADFMGNNDQYNEGDPFQDLRITKRKMIALFLYKLSQDPKNTQTVALQDVHNVYFEVCYEENAITDDFLKNKWNQVACLQGVAPGEDGKFKKVMKALATFLGLQNPLKQVVDKDKPYGGWSHQVWNDKNGQILFSSDKDATYTIEKGDIKKLDQISWSNPNLLRDILKSID